MIVRKNFFVPKFIFSGNSCINWVNFKRYNQTVDLLVDSGASICAIKRSVLDNSINKPKFYDDQFEINGIGGCLMSEGYVFLDLY